MAKARKDPQGRALRKGESFRTLQTMYTYTYTDPCGRRQFLYSKKLTDLREKEENLLRNQLDGLDVYAAGKSNLNFVFDRYMSTKTKLRETTYSGYMYTYNHFVRDGFGKHKIADIKYSDVLQFYEQLLDKNDIAISTLESIQTVLHPTFQLAVRDSIIRLNPSDEVIAEIKKNSDKAKGVRHALTKEQEKAFLDCLNEEQHSRWRPMFRVLLGTGCRIGELISLRWEDLNMESRRISINHSISYYADYKKEKFKSKYKVHRPKTDAGIRTIPMLDDVYEAFNEERQYQLDHAECCLTEVEGMSGFIFYNRFKNIHNPQAVNRAISRITDDYNAVEEVEARKEKRETVLIPKFSCHHLRHTFCTRLCERESNIKVIQSIMGHADIKTTMDIYAEVTDAMKKESFENLSQQWKLG